MIVTAKYVILYIEDVDLNYMHNKPTLEESVILYIEDVDLNYRHDNHAAGTDGHPLH